MIIFSSQKGISRNILSGVCALLLLSACGSDDSNSTGSGSSTQNENVSVVGAQLIGTCELSSSQQELWDAHNLARSEARFCGDDYYEAVQALNWHCDLAQSAENHSVDMATQNYFSHDAPDGSDFVYRASEAGYGNFPTGENIAAGQQSVQAVMSSWIASSGHCANIMSDFSTEMGAAGIEADGADYSIYWTAVFGRD